jgi:hypothetical protein
MYSFTGSHSLYVSASSNGVQINPILCSQYINVVFRTTISSLVTLIVFSDDNNKFSQLIDNGTSVVSGTRALAFLRCSITVHVFRIPLSLTLGPNL